MDLIKALKTWHSLGLTTNDYTEPETDNYIIEFLDSNNNVVGNIIAYTGQGIRWNYPELLMETVRKQELRG